MTSDVDRPRQGLLYVPAIDKGPMANAEVGRTRAHSGTRAAMDRGRSQPDFSRGRSLARSAVGRRDCRRYHLAEWGSSTPCRCGIHTGCRCDALPVATLSGAHGRQVCTVIEAAAGLDLARAARLAEKRDPDAGEAQTRIWKRWLLRENMPLDHYDDLDGTLAIGALRGGSPIGQAPRVIHNVIGRRAKAPLGPSVWLVDEADPEGAWLAEPWCAASVALLDAAPAFGARLISLSGKTTTFLQPSGATSPLRSRFEFLRGDCLVEQVAASARQARSEPASVHKRSVNP